MRRKDREITDFEEQLSILTAAQVCRVALHGQPYPYIVPMNLGVLVREGRVFLYFHCAREGEKLERMRANPHAAFEVDRSFGITGEGERACVYGYAFESVIGRGTLRMVEGPEKREGLLAIMRQLVPERSFVIEDEQLHGVAVLCLEVSAMTGKRRALP